MTPAEVIATKLSGNDEIITGITILPGLPDNELELISNCNGIDEGQYGELIELLKVSSGISTGIEFDFKGLVSMVDEYDIGKPGECVLNAVEFGCDKCGNNWICEIINRRIENIIFLCHDPSIIVYESNGLTEFLDRLVTNRCETARVGSDDGNWYKVNGGGIVRNDKIEWDLSACIPGSSVPLYLYYDKVHDLTRDGNSLRFSMGYHKRNMWQRLRDKWR